MAGSSQEIEAGRAFVKISTKDSAFEAGLKKAEGRLKAFGGVVAGIGGGVAGLGGALLAPLLAGLGTFIERGSEIQHTADRLGISAEAVQTLGAAAKVSGTDMEGLGRAFFKFNRETGKGLDDFVAEIDALPGKANAAAAAFDKFGRHGLDVLQVARHFQNTGGLGSFLEGKKATVLSNEDVENAEKLHGALQSVLGLPKAIALQLGAALGEQLTPFVDGVKNAVKYVAIFVKEHRQIAVVVAAVGGALVAAGSVIIGFGAAIAGVGAALPFVLVGIKALLIVGAALIGLGIQIYLGWQAVKLLMETFPETFAQFVGWLNRMKANLLEFWGRLKDTWSGISAAIKNGNWGTAVQIAWLEIKAEFLRGMRDVHNLWASFVDALGEMWTKQVTSRIKAAWDYVASGKSWEQALEDARKELLDPKRAAHHAENDERTKAYNDRIRNLDEERKRLSDEEKRKAAQVKIPKAVQSHAYGPMEVSDLAQGTFSSYALAVSFGLANAKVTERIAKAAEGTQQNTKDIADKMGDGLDFD